LCLSFNHIANASVSEYFRYTIVIDPGHGGWDGGTVGSTSKVTEAELNLKVSKILKKYLENYGFNVILTRTSNLALGKNKIDDMEKRKQIIEKYNPTMVVSIHMNSFTDINEYGTQAYYENGDESSKLLADSIQSQMTKVLPNAREFANHGEYYILECSTIPTCIVECGFLSNPNDEALLNSEDYREKLAYSIYGGIVKYLIATEINIIE
jgi:N-acetylmuramoyl-L-alanine amidase